MPSARLTQEIAGAFLAGPPDKMAVAVSGGGDSMALLHLMYQYCELHGSQLFAVTVNHGLRAGAAQEAEAVGAFCATLGVPHYILVWDDWDGTGNLQAQARDARYRRISDWAARRGISSVALGHTADDQAETVLMRLSRRAGVDGLSAMPRVTRRHGVDWVRPLLSVTRADLRTYLRRHQITWAEDPSNEDMRFERIKARKALVALGDLGIDADGLAMVAEQMRAARTALNWQTFLAARDIATVVSGAVVLNERRLHGLPDEIQRRLVVGAMGWISGSTYPPRRAAVATLMAALRKGQGSTVDGCHARRVKGNIWIFRELEAVRYMIVAPGVLWDARWRVTPVAGAAITEGLCIGPLGPGGVEQCDDWRISGLPLPVVMSTPAVWRDDTLVAAPLVRPDQNWHAAVEGGDETFFAGLLSH